MRSNIINNTDNYHTGNREHHIQTVQIITYQEWERFRELFGFDYLYVADLQEHLYNGELYISLIREVNYGMENTRAICIVHTRPQRYFVDGDTSTFQYTNGDVTHTSIRELFDENLNTIIERMTEYDILELVAEHNSARHLIANYFLDGFVSIRPVDEEEEEEHNEVVLVPPPPLNMEFDFAHHYFAEIGIIDYIDNDDYANADQNIIPYWFENDQHIQQLREIQAGYMNARG